MGRLLVMLLSLLILSCCSKQERQVHEPMSEVPKAVPYGLMVQIPRDTIAEKDPALRRVNNVLFEGEELYSGYLLISYANGNVKQLQSYFRGRLEGATTRWYPEGETESVRFYHKGLKTGTHKGYFANGGPKFSYDFWQGNYHGIYQEWFPDGSPSKLGHFKEGAEVGRHKMWDAFGKIRANYAIKDGRRFGLTGAKPCYSKIHM